MKKPLFLVLSQALEARRVLLLKPCPAAWEAPLWNANKWVDFLHSLAKNHLPSGCGIDNGCVLDLIHSTPQKLIIHFSYHHMNQDGFYDGWTDHSVTVTPVFGGFNLKITRGSCNLSLFQRLQEDLHQVFWEALRAEVEEFPSMT